jgi:hypothetical protein
MTLHASAPGRARSSGDDPEPSCAPSWPGTDASLALALYAIWATRTGRTLRPVPVTELTPEELIDFWADDQLDQPPQQQ